MKPLLHWQTPAERKALALQDVQVIEVPLQVEQEGSQAAHKLLTSLKNPTLQKQVPPLKVERAPEQPVHWLYFGPEQVEQLESQETQDFPSVLKVNPGLQTQAFPAIAELATHVKQMVESAALQVAQVPLQVEHTPVAVFKKKPVAQSHSLRAVVESLLKAFGLQVSH